jgi:WhiB family redox-sensing transcriptional regulator
MSRYTRPPNWRASALCAQTDPDLWFPEHGVNRGAIAVARRICNQCPVRNECLDEGIKTYPAWGIWGGYTAFELRAFRRKPGKGADHDDYNLTA